MAGIIAKYVILPGFLAYALMQLVKPSEEEKKKIAKYSNNNAGYSQVLRAAAAPGAKPIYRQKPGEQHPIPGMAEAARKV